MASTSDGCSATCHTSSQDPLPYPLPPPPKRTHWQAFSSHDSVLLSSPPILSPLSSLSFSILGAVPAALRVVRFCCGDFHNCGWMLNR
eukprot:c25059_g3_i1 orf=56-319(+)